MPHSARIIIRHAPERRTLRCSATRQAETTIDTVGGAIQRVDRRIDEELAARPLQAQARARVRPMNRMYTKWHCRGARMRIDTVSRMQLDAQTAGAHDAGHELRSLLARLAARVTECESGISFASGEHVRRARQWASTGHISQALRSSLLSLILSQVSAVYLCFDLTLNHGCSRPLPDMPDALRAMPARWWGRG